MNAGPTIAGRPEARYESYARGYAGCGTHIIDTSYRRSYGRMVEAIVCQNHSTEEYYQNDIFMNRPMDIIGTYIRLEPLVKDRHAQELIHSTCTGEATMEYLSSYNPNDIWCFHDDGPFRSVEELSTSKYIYPAGNDPTNRKSNTASFAIRQNITHHFLGIVALINDEPEHLSIQIQTPLMVPKCQLSSKECIEAYFLILDRLFAYGYRRIAISIDTQDIQSIQFVYRLGFTFEGCCYKHRIVKDANRNSNIYAIINSDWKQTIIASNTADSSSKSGSGHGARAALYKKLYGASKFRADQSNERYEAELEEQTLGLLEQKKKEAIGLDGKHVTANSKKNE
jgi:hypothetical protein